MKLLRTIAFTATVLAGSAFLLHAQDQPKEKFWTTPQIAWQSANFAAGAADIAITCNNLHRGWVEATAPSQSCAGIAAWVFGSKAAELGASYLFARSGHERIALAIPRFAVGASGFAITYNLWPRKGHKCEPNWPCN